MAKNICRKTLSFGGVFVLFCLPILSACSSTYSASQTLAEDSYLVYKDTYKAYAEAEEQYMNILFNLERLPEEEELWTMKRSQIAELEQLRTLMLQARADLDDAVQAWDAHLQEKYAEIQKGKTFKNPNFRGDDGRRSSPGELLPHEAAKIGKNSNEDF